MAEQFYTQAIRTDTSYAPAYLNRANTRVRNGDLKEALQDYQRYLGLDPASPQRPQIERLVDLIQEIFAEAEIRRLMAQESSRADAEKRQRLINEELAAALPEMLEAELLQDESTDEFAGEENTADAGADTGVNSGDEADKRDIEWRGDSIQRK
jgi:tetratricopeptide (TPR) repeat protein